MFCDVKLDVGLSCGSVENHNGTQKTKHFAEDLLIVI